MLRSITVTLVATLASATLFAGYRPPSEKERWTSLTLDGFTIISNAHDKTTERLALDLVRMRSAMSRVSKLKVTSPMPTKILIFKNQDDFNGFAEIALNRKANVAGVFLSHRDGNYIAVNGDSEEAAGIMYHELTHHFIRNTFTNVPLWFHEGVAEFYSAFDASGRGVRIGIPIIAHVHLLRERRLMPMKEFFAMEADSKDYNEGIRQGIFYAQAWAFVHYLLLGNTDRTPQLGTFLTLLESGKPTEAAFTEAFRSDYETFQKELQTYVKSNVLKGYEIDRSELSYSEPSRPEPIPHGEVLFHFGDFLGHASPQSAAEGERLLRASLSLQPKRAEAHAFIGFLREASGDSKTAVEFYETAVKLGGDNFLTYLLAAESIMRRLNGEPVEPGSTNADVLRARELFQKSIRLNGSVARSFAGLGSTYIVTQGDVKPGIEALERSIAMDPRAAHVVADLSMLYARAGDHRKAEALVRKVTRESSDRRLAEHASRTLLYSKVEQAQTLLAQGKVDEAQSILRKLQAETTDAQLKEELTVMLAVIDRQARANAEIDQYNSAIEKANGGKYAEALEIVEQLIASSKNEDLVKAAKEIRDKLLPVVKKK